MKYNKEYFDTSTTKADSIYNFYKSFLIECGINLENKKVCDVGCATGNFIKTLVETNDCYGVDISPYAINTCKKRFPAISDHFIINNLDEETFKIDKKFDIISLFDVIEHLYNFVHFKKIIQDNLKEDGYLIITTPNTNSFLRFLNKNSFTGEMDKTHVILFTPYILDFMLKRLKLKKVALFTPYNFYFKNNIITQNLLLGGQIVAIYKK